MELIWNIVQFIMVAAIILAAIVAGILFVLGVVALSGIIGSVFSLINYGRSAMENLNFVTWTWDKGDEPAKRSYFFGPGYQQLIETVKGAFQNNHETAKKFHSVTERYKRDISTDDIVESCFTICAYAVDIGGSICVYVCGTIATILFAGIHGLITASIMVVIYVIFTVVWGIDRCYLGIKKIFTICPYCKNRSMIPHYECPSCGNIHKKLIPGPYGIFYHKCSGCGTKLGSTFFTGRIKYDAYCSCCGNSLVSSDSRPLVFQLIGGTGVGKTVYLSACYHLFKECLDRSDDIEYTIPERYQSYFDELEMYYMGTDNDFTKFKNSQLYPLILQNKKGFKWMFSMFDISGEMFDGVSSEGVEQQKQFGYCNGFIFIIDPFCIDSQLTSTEFEGESFFSLVSLERVMDSFLNYMSELSDRKVTVRNNTPVAIVIGKGDVPGAYERLSKNNIDKLYNTLTDENKSWIYARDIICRQFLEDIGFSNAIGNIESAFTNVHYFPASAMGHSPNNETYESWGILEPVEWLIKEADSQLADSLQFSEK